MNADGSRGMNKYAQTNQELKRKPHSQAETMEILKAGERDPPRLHQRQTMALCNREDSPKRPHRTAERKKLMKHIV